jgi:RHS repeat-associated protein
LSGTTPTANLVGGLGVDDVLTRTDSTGTRAFLTDGLGSTLALVDGSGTKQTSYTYDAFGGTSITGQTNGNSQQYTGRENDGTGLYYYRARYYSPSLGRFISEDPIGFAGGGNLYTYVNNDPVNLINPYGLESGGPQNGSGVSGVVLPPGLDRPPGHQFPTFELPSLAEQLNCRQCGGGMVGGGRGDGPSGGDRGGGGHRSVKLPSSPGKMQKEVERGQAPRTVDRVDVPRFPYEKPGGHFRDGTALYNDGSWRYGQRDLTRTEKEWLRSHGWKIPGE